MSKSLVILTDNEPTTTSLVIAKETETEHASIILQQRSRKPTVSIVG